jgi:energy-converting hydrogenase Eha subunit A
MKWVGFYVATNSDQRWYLIQGYLWVSALLVIQRYSRRAKDNWYKEQYNIAVAKRKNPNKPVKVPELKLFIYPREFQSQKRFTVGQVINASKWYLSNILSIHSYQAFVLALLILIFVRHKFALAIVYLLILGLSVITKEKWWRKSSIPLRLFTAWVGIAILLQYLLKLGLPTGMDTPWKTWTWPSSWSSDTPDWLGINIQSPWVLVGS